MNRTLSLISIFLIALVSCVPPATAGEAKDDSDCVASATDIGEGKRLGLCERSMHGDYGEATVYDSSDQILIGQNLAARNPAVMEKLSPAWRDAYKSLQLPDLNGDYGYTVTPIPGKEHFYKFQWS